MLFTKAKHCLNGFLCINCRNSQEFRKELAKVFDLPDDNLNFKCPHNQTNITTEFVKVDYEEIRSKPSIFNSDVVSNRSPLPCSACGKQRTK